MNLFINPMNNPLLVLDPYKAIAKDAIVGIGGFATIKLLASGVEVLGASIKHLELGGLRDSQANLIGVALLAVGSYMMMNRGFLVQEKAMAFLAGAIAAMPRIRNSDELGLISYNNDIVKAVALGVLFGALGKIIHD